MAAPGPNVVTGAFSFAGKYLAAEGKRVQTLANHPNRCDPTTATIGARPLDCARPDALTQPRNGP